MFTFPHPYDLLKGENGNGAFTFCITHCNGHNNWCSFQMCDHKYFQTGKVEILILSSWKLVECNWRLVEDYQKPKISSSFFVILLASLLEKATSTKSSTAVSFNRSLNSHFWSFFMQACCNGSRSKAWYLFSGSCGPSSEFPTGFQSKRLGFTPVPRHHNLNLHVRCHGMSLL